MDESSYDRSGRRSMPASRLFELLLRIKESVGEETFLDALALIEVAGPHPTSPRRAGEGEACGPEGCPPLVPVRAPVQRC
jgi:hypothetical protein